MSRKIIFAVISLSLSVVTVAAALVIVVDVTVAQNPISTPIAQSTITPTATPLFCVTQEELLSTYREVLDGSKAAIENIQSTNKEVLDSSQAAIENVQSTTKTVLWLVGAAFTLLTLEGLGGLWLTQKTARDVAKSVQAVERARQQAHEAAQEVGQVKNALGDIQSSYKDLKEQMDRARGQIEAMHVELSNLGEDIDWYRRLMVIDQVTKDGLRLFREGQSEWEDAANSLREQLEYEDPTARWYVVLAFQRWAECDPRSMPQLQSRIERILESLIDSEPERLVRLEAERTLQVLRRRGEEK